LSPLVTGPLAASFCASVAALSLHRTHSGFFFAPFALSRLREQLDGTLPG
jgi:hypothetical protein